RRMVFSRTQVVAWLGSCNSAPVRKAIRLWRSTKTPTAAGVSARRFVSTTDRRGGAAVPKDDNTKHAAIDAERKAVHEARNAAQPKPKKEVPVYTDWFNGRFWKEWVIGERNKPSERRSKEIIFRCHLQPELGHLRLDEINAEVVQKLRAKLVDE